MSRKAPETVRGTRGPIVPQAGAQEKPASTPAAPAPLASFTKKPGFRRFVSPNHVGYRLTITMPDSYRDPKTGRLVSDKGKTAVFKEGYFETDDPETIERIVKSNAFASSEIRDLDVEEEKQRLDAVESLVGLVKTSPDPEVRARLAEALGLIVAEEFEVPAKKEDEKAEA